MQIGLKLQDTVQTIKCDANADSKGIHTKNNMSSSPEVGVHNVGLQENNNYIQIPDKPSWSIKYFYCSYFSITELGDNCIQICHLGR